MSEPIPDINKTNPITDHFDGGLNDKIVIDRDERDPEGNGSHNYHLSIVYGDHGTVDQHGDPETLQETTGWIRFPRGPQPEFGPGGASGATNEALVAVLLDRLRGFQAGPRACFDNAAAMSCLKEALGWMKLRANPESPVPPHREVAVIDIQPGDTLLISGPVSMRNAQNIREALGRRPTGLTAMFLGKGVDVQILRGVTRDTEIQLKEDPDGT